MEQLCDCVCGHYTWINFKTCCSSVFSKRPGLTWVYANEFSKVLLMMYTPETYSEPCQTSMVERFYENSTASKVSVLLRISPYSVRIRENADQNNSEYGHFTHRVGNG